MRGRLILKAICFSLVGGSLMTGTAVNGHDVTFAWSENQEPDLGGYRIHFGVASRTYSQVIDVGKATTGTASNLIAGTKYYFALTAYNLAGLQSDFTGELVYTVPMTEPEPPPRVYLYVVPPAQARLTVTGVTNRAYVVEASPDLRTWNPLQTITLDANGSGVVMENNPALGTKRFYRARAL